MKKRITNRITMFKTVLTHGNLNRGIISTNIGLHNVWIKFSTHMDEVIQLAQEQTMNRKGITLNKKAVRETLVLAVEEASGIIMSYASGIRDHQLYGSVKYSLTKLREMRDMTFKIHAQTVIDLLIMHQSALVNYNVDADYIVAVSDIYSKYDDILVLPAIARNVRKTATSDLEEKVKEVSDFLKNDLDRLMVVLKNPHPAFYSIYKNARRIINSSIRHKQKANATIKGIIKNEENSEAIAHAFIQVINTKIVVITNENGEFAINNLSTGTYSIKINTANYESKIIDNIIIKSPETNEQEITLTARSANNQIHCSDRIVA
ncbi:MAG: carboxypeptidase-like regulatory domain-containing protein [Chitinophagales bacterium]